MVYPWLSTKMAILSPYSKKTNIKGGEKSPPFFYFLIFSIVFFFIFHTGYAFSENFYFKVDTKSNFINLFEAENFSPKFLFLNKEVLYLSCYGELGSRVKDWLISGFYDANINSYLNKDTISFINSILDKDIPIGKKYDLLISVDGYTILGGKLEKNFLISKNLNLDLIFKLFYGTNIQRGKLWGDFTRIDEESYSFNLFLDYLYNNNYLYKRKDLIAGKGFGYSSDLGININIINNLTFSIFLENMFGEIYWFSVPYTLGDATSEREYFDEYGNIVYRPLIRGYEGYKDYIQRLPCKLNLSLEFDKNEYLFITKLFFSENYSFYEFSAIRLFTKNTKKVIGNKNINSIYYYVIDNDFICFNLFLDNLKSFNVFINLSILM